MGGVNLYALGDNNTVNLTDRLGLAVAPDLTSLLWLWRTAHVPYLTLIAIARGADPVLHDWIHHYVHGNGETRILPHRVAKSLVFLPVLSLNVFPGAMSIVSRAVKEQKCLDIPEEGFGFDGISGLADMGLGQFTIAVKGRVCCDRSQTKSGWRFNGQIQFRDRFDFNVLAGGRGFWGEARVWAAAVLLFGGNPFDITSHWLQANQSYPGEAGQLGMRW
jgi:hypothetical protein